MKRLSLIVAALAFASAAFAQPGPSNPGLTVNGAVTTGHCLKFLNRAQVQDAGSPCASGALTNTHVFVGNAGNVATDVPLSQDCTMANTGAITCTKTNNVAFAPSATTDTTNANNISSGTLAAARGGAGTITGALRGNGAGVVTQAACADLSNGATGCSTATGTSGATIPLNNGNNTLSGTNNQTGDFYMGSGRPWCDVRSHGAVGDGVTNDTTAINACITALAAMGGGNVFFPPGTYCSFTGININSQNVWFVGAGGDGILTTAASNNGGFVRAASSLDTCAHDVTLLQMSSTRVGVAHMQINGSAVIAGVASTHTTVVVNSTCSMCVLNFVTITGGFQGLFSAGADLSVLNSSVGYVYGQGSLVQLQGGNSFFIRDKLDQNPVTGCTMTQAKVVAAAWIANHAYSACAVVTVVANTFTYVLQARVGGTSAPVTQPGIANYGTDIVDNTVTWQLLRPNAYVAVTFDSNIAAENFFQVDMTGPFSNVIVAQNSLSQTAPTGVNIVHSFVNGGQSNDILLLAGTNFTIADTQICCSGGPGVTTSTSWGGDLILSNNQIVQNAGGGVSLGVGANNTIIGNMISGNTGVGVTTAASLNAFNIGLNTFFSTLFGSNSGNAVTIGATPTHCNVSNNISNGATYSVATCTAAGNL